MDVSGMGSLSSAMTQEQTGAAAAMLVLKKSIDLEASNAQQLLQALPQVSSNPPNLGNSVDIKA
ncbi:hypothetical protein BJN45_00020 [Azonexus hydrophilus]|uniref:Motility protein n=1 Tax=Azonexus hydrophilus TaxID=418702 RepID=A0A1R1IBX9_9RHOO|nr:YjfB family protein [Azonexus hydrophilus]OMG56069.1 hypothetical protein BJN45_00020 [Azonexus hydrophilus]